MRSLLRAVLFIAAAAVAPTAAAAPHDVLGLTREQVRDGKQVKQAYKSLALKWHPDRAPAGDEAAQKLHHTTFLAVAEAYQALDNDEKRAAYAGGGSQGSHGEWRPAHDEQRGEHGRQHGADFGFDVFEQVFGTRDVRAVVDDFFSDNVDLDAVLSSLGGQAQGHQQGQGQQPPRKEKADDPFAAFGFGGMAGGATGGGTVHVQTFSSSFSSSHSSSNSHSSSSGDGGATFSRTETKIGPDGKRVTKSVSGASGGNIQVVHETKDAAGNTVRREGTSPAGAAMGGTVTRGEL